jgi:hypothetical protein
MTKLKLSQYVPPVLLNPATLLLHHVDVPPSLVADLPSLVAVPRDPEDAAESAVPPSRTTGVRTNEVEAGTVTAMIVVPAPPVTIEAEMIDASATNIDAVTTDASVRKVSTMGLINHSFTIDPKVPSTLTTPATPRRRQA